MASIVRFAAAIVVAWSLAASVAGGTWKTEHDAQGRLRVVLSLASDELERWRNLPEEDRRRQSIIRVQVGSTPDPERAAILGRVTLSDDAVSFTPQFPFRPGVTYCATLWLPAPETEPSARNDANSSRAGGRPANHRYVFTVPRPQPEEPAEVVGIYPSADVLPENLLRFYVHFSVPMRRGVVYDHVTLLNDRGQAVDLPFLEIAEELWSPDGQRITLLFDPGRIKRGLKPREELGPILEQGRQYTLVIDAQWPDAYGRTLKAAVRKTFTVAAPDDTQPSPNRWKLTAPAAASRDPLTVTFDEPLDHAMLQRVLDIQTVDGRSIVGSIVISNHQQRWQFTPHAAWPPGQYVLRVETILEDLAGNSIQRPFELENFRDIQQQVVPRHVDIPFEVKSAPTF